MGRTRAIGGHHRHPSGRSDDYLTPPELIKLLGPFHLDPCASRRQPWRTAKVQYTDRGLEQPWRGMVWLNCPYGKETGRWLARLAVHGNGLALVYARTDTQAFHEHVFPKATAILFFEGRLFFHYPDGRRAVNNCGGPSVLIAYGRAAAERLRRAEQYGHIVRL